MKTRHRAALVAAFLFASARDAAAADFGATFEPKAVESHLEGRELRVIVVPAGPRAKKSEPAAAALAKAFASGERVANVIGKDTFGASDGLDDSEIVKRASALPVDRIAIVRVFPEDGSADPTKAVVVVYDPKGSVVAAFDGEAGKPLAMGRDARGSFGLSRETAESVRSVRDGAEVASSEAQKKYDESYVWFEDFVGVSMNTGAVVAQWTQPYKGKFKQPLEGADFYVAVGREDYAERYRKMRIAQLIVGGVGVAALIAGGIYMIKGIVGTGSGCPSEDRAYAACNARQDEDMKTGFIVGGAIMGAGIVAGFVAGTVLSPHPVDAPTARRLADEHNEKLQKDLGVEARAESGGFDDSHVDEDTTSGVAFAPWFDGHGGGLVAGLTF